MFSQLNGPMLSLIKDASKWLNKKKWQNENGQTNTNISY